MDKIPSTQSPIPPITRKQILFSQIRHKRSRYQIIISLHKFPNRCPQKQSRQKPKLNVLCSQATRSSIRDIISMILRGLPKSSKSSTSLIYSVLKYSRIYLTAKPSYFFFHGFIMRTLHHIKHQICISLIPQILQKQKIIHIIR